MPDRASTDGDGVEALAQRDRPASADGGPAWLAWLVLVLAITFAASARILGTLGDPGFDREHANGLLRSDPGLLYYITERIIESDGGVPDDFHADPNVQHPDRVDLARMFTVGQEFLVAWAWRAFGSDVPLHVFCVFFFSILASLTIAGVFGATRELTGSWRWAAVAAVFYVGIAVNFRTTGFILIREDLSIPLFAAHVWSLARLFRRPSPGLAVLSGLLATAALATWHAMGFVVALELGALVAWAVVSGDNPFARREARWLLVTVLASSLAVPVLRAKLFPLSLPVVLAASLAVTALGARAWPPSGASAWRRSATWTAAFALLFTVARAVAGAFEGGGDYGHVLGLLTAKLRHLGQLPDDPTRLSPDVRLLWQGPFSTALAEDLAFGLPGALLAAAFAFTVGLRLARRRRLDAGLAVTLAFLALGLVAGLLIRRTLVIPGFAAPIAAAVAFERISSARPGGRHLGTWLVSGLGLAGAVLVSIGLAGAPLGWYRPAARGAELRALTSWVADNVPPDAAILGDFVASTSILAHSRHAIALQPKYETRTTRERIGAFYRTFAHGTPGELRELADELECEYVLIDTEMLWRAGRYVLGIPVSQTVPAKGTCAYFFANQNPAALTGVPGFELVYRSPAATGMDLFRLYRLR